MQTHDTVREWSTTDIAVIHIIFTASAYGGVMEVVVLDFETTGLSCDRNRVIEIGAVILNREGEIINTFQTLCNPPLEKKLPNMITRLTGISDCMLLGQPSTASAMESLYHFLGNRPIIAHNASFDSRFLIAEMKRINRVIFNQFLCSLLISRRILLHAKSYKLSRLKEFINFKADINHKDHRALDDVLVTVALWKHLLLQLSTTYSISNSLYSFDFMKTISRLPIKQVAAFLSKAGGNDRKEDDVSGIKPLSAKGTSVIIEVRCDAVVSSNNIKNYFGKELHVSVASEVVIKKTDCEEIPIQEALVLQDRKRDLILPTIMSSSCQSPEKVLLQESSLRLISSPGTGCAELKVKLIEGINSTVVDENTNPAKRRSLRHSNPF